MKWLRLAMAATLAMSLCVNDSLAGGPSRGRSGGSGTGSSRSSTSVRGYTRTNGSHVAPYRRSTGDGTTKNNYSTKGNTNPFTGKPGTKSPARP